MSSAENNEAAEAPMTPLELLELSNQSLVVLDRIRLEAERMFGENLVWRANLEQGMKALTVLCKSLVKVVPRQQR